MLAIKGLYMPYGVRRLNHGIGIGIGISEAGHTFLRHARATLGALQRMTADLAQFSQRCRELSASSRTRMRLSRRCLAHLAAFSATTPTSTSKSKSKSSSVRAMRSSRPLRKGWPISASSLRRPRAWRSCVSLCHRPPVRGCARSRRTLRAATGDRLCRSYRSRFRWSRTRLVDSDVPRKSGEATALHLAAPHLAWQLRVDLPPGRKRRGRRGIP
jgi:hypothetical protein